MPLKPKARLLAASRKQQIVETILDLVEKRGTEAVSAQLVADAIGVTQPAVFRHFPTKEAMWLAVMDWLELHLVVLYASARDRSDEPALAILGGIFLGHIRLIQERPALVKLVFSDHLRQTYPSLQKRFAAIHSAYMARLGVLIEQAKSEGTVRGSISSDDACATFLALIQGLGFQFAIAHVPMPLMKRAEFAVSSYLCSMMVPDELGERALVLVADARRAAEA